MRTLTLALALLAPLLLSACDAGSPDDADGLHTYELRVTSAGEAELQVGVTTWRSNDYNDFSIDEFTADAPLTRTYRGTSLVGAVEVLAGDPVVVVLMRDGEEVDRESSDDPDWDGDVRVIG